MDINEHTNSKRNFLMSALGLGAIPSLAMTGLPAASLSRKKGPRADYFPNVLLQTHEGKSVRFYDDIVHNKKVVFSMMYTVCTNLCPPSTANLVKVQEGLQRYLGKEIFMYSLSLRPEFDTPSALREYMKQYDIGPGWTFLTGKTADMEIIRRRLGFYDVDPASDADIAQHTGMVRFGDEKRDRWAMMPAQANASQIARSILML